MGALAHAVRQGKALYVGLSNYPADRTREAAAILRISRNAAYAAARQWRATGGEAGLPCIEIGRTLRVPRADLDRLLGRHGPSQAVA